jgi:hypothetical protein
MNLPRNPQKQELSAHSAGEQAPDEMKAGGDGVVARVRDFM